MYANGNHEHMSGADEPATNQEDAAGARDDEAKRVSASVDIPVDKLFEFVQKVLDEGSARRLVLRERAGRVLLDVPLGPSALVGAFGFLLMPLWLRIVTVVGVLSSITIEIHREITDDEAAGDDPAAGGRAQRITIESDDAPGDDELV